MRRTILKSGVALVLAAAIASSAAPVPAPNTNPAAATKRPAIEKPEAQPAKKLSARPFHGKLAAVDKLGKTILIGKSTYLITPETKITKAGKAATLDDGVVGEEAGGYARPNEAGKMVAASLRFGPKADRPGAAKPTGKAKAN